jgi:hypothetical protein
MGDWRLNDCTLYVTKEPCPMWAGVIVHLRLARMIFGASDPKGGAAGSALSAPNGSKAEQIWRCSPFHWIHDPQMHIRFAGCRPFGAPLLSAATRNLMHITLFKPGRMPIPAKLYGGTQRLHTF